MVTYRINLIKNTMITVVAAAVLFMTGTAFAGTPLWTFQPLTDTTINVRTNGAATIKYEVTNQSRKPHTLVMQPISGITQVTTAGNCPNPFVLGYQQSCTLTLEVTGSALQGNVVGGPEVCQRADCGLQCYQPSAANSINVTFIPEPGSTTLSASVSSLILSVNDTDLNPQLTGTPRIITIKNTGSSYPAADVSYSISPALPSGTSISPASCGTIAPGGTCILTITPGATPTTVPAPETGSAPIPNVVTVSGSNTNSTTTDVIVLTFGNILQNGLVFSIDDTTANTESVDGKVVGEVGQQFTSPWTIPSSDIPVAESLTDGVGNTNAIVADAACANNQSDCAAQRCRNFSADWYLPAVAELSDVHGALCSNAPSPCDFGRFTGIYKSSSQINENSAWSVVFPLGVEGSDLKVTDQPVRCVRAF